MLVKKYFYSLNSLLGKKPKASVARQFEIEKERIIIDGKINK